MPGNTSLNFKRCIKPQNGPYDSPHDILLVLVVLFLVLPAASLAVRAVPVEQDDQRDEEEAVRDRDRRHHVSNALSKTGNKAQ